MKFVEARGDPFEVEGDYESRVDADIARALNRIEGRVRGRDGKRFDMLATIIQILAGVETDDLRRIASQLQRQYWTPIKTSRMSPERGPSTAGADWDEFL